MGRTSLVVSQDPDLAEPQPEAPHGHQASFAVGLAFVNTLETDRGRTIEHLPTVQAALRWLRSHSLMHQDAMELAVLTLGADAVAGDRVLGRIHRVRAAMRELADATVERRPPEPRHLDRVNRAL